MQPERNVLIGCTGSVASIKIPLLIEELWQGQHFKINIKIIATDHAKHFFRASELPSNVELLGDDNEWRMWRQRGDPVLHIELGKWADLFLVAPLDANSLAKIATGICDNLLMCTIRAWDLSKPLLFCPAMNTRMYNHPLTAEQINKLQSWGYIEIPCTSKTLMCGDTGNGAMAEIPTIIEKLKVLLRKL